MRDRSGLAFVGLLLFVGCLIVVAVGLNAQKFDAHGSLTLTSKSIRQESNGVSPIYNSPCSGTDGATYLTAGAQVTVTDAHGTTIAIGQLDPGKYDRGNCKFTFAVLDIPADHDIYGVTISEHGGRQFNRAQMQAGPLLGITDPLSQF